MQDSLVQCFLFQEEDYYGEQGLVDIPCPEFDLSHQLVAVSAFEYTLLPRIPVMLKCWLLLLHLQYFFL